MKPLTIHWCSPLDSGQKKASGDYQVGVFDVDEMIDFAKAAENLGIDSLLMGISYHMPDPLPILGALSRETERMRYILAYRPGLLSPTLFAQVVNTISWMGDKRIALNIVAGISPAEQAYYGDYLNHSERYARTNEFLDIVSHFWKAGEPLDYEGKHYRIQNGQLGLGFKDGARPKVYISGGSEDAERTARQHGDCLLCYGDLPENFAPLARRLASHNVSLGIRMHVIARPTRQQALDDIAEMMSAADEERKRQIRAFVDKCDSAAVQKSFDLAAKAKDDWLSPMIWSGAVAYRGGPALTVAGSYDEVAAYLMEYKYAGVSEFIFSGWPTRDEMERFGQEVMPRLRALETQVEAAHG